MTLQQSNLNKILKISTHLEVVACRGLRRLESWNEKNDVIAIASEFRLDQP